MNRRFNVLAFISVMVLSIIVIGLTFKDSASRPADRATIHCGQIRNLNDDGVIVTLQMKRYPTADELYDLRRGELYDVRFAAPADVIEFETPFTLYKAENFLSLLDEIGYLIMQECDNLSDCTETARRKCGGDEQVTALEFSPVKQVCSFDCKNMTSWVYLCADAPSERQ